MDEITAFLSDPNIAFALFVIGALGIAIEVVHPNAVTGVLGAVAIVLSLIGFGNLPVNTAALLLIAFAFVLFIAETQFTSHGVLTVLAIVALALGAIFLYSDTPTSSGEVAHVSPVLIVLSVGDDDAAHGPRLDRRRPRAPDAAPKGHRRHAPGSGDPGRRPGAARAAGDRPAGRRDLERPNAHRGACPRDTPVRLVGFDGLIAIVEPLEAAPPSVVPAPAASLPAERT